MDMGIVCIGMFVGDVRLIPIPHLLHITFRQFCQPPVGQPVFRCWGKGNVQDGLLRIAVCQQVILKESNAKRMSSLGNPSRSEIIRLPERISAVPAATFS